MHKMKSCEVWQKIESQGKSVQKLLRIPKKDGRTTSRAPVSVMTDGRTDKKKQDS